MAAKKKPWNAAIPPEELFPALHGGKHVPPPALPDKVLPGHSTPPFAALPERWQILRIGPDGAESWHTAGLGPWVGIEAKARARARALEAEDKGARYEVRKV